MAVARAVSRLPRRDEPHPRPELDRAGDSHRHGAAWLAGPARGRAPASSSRPHSSSASSHGPTYDTGRFLEVAGVLRGIAPVVIAVVVSALWQLGRTAVKSAALALLGLGALVALLAGVHELVVLLVAGVISAACRWIPCARAGPRRSWALLADGRHCRDWGRADGRVSRAALPARRPVLAVVAVSGLRQDRRGAVWQRLRVARVPACRCGRASWLAHRAATAGRRRGGAGHAGSTLHDGDLRRLSSRRGRRARRWRRWASFFPRSCSWR